jgi:HemY protein
VRGLFWVLASFGLAVAVALGARLNEGYVLLVFPPYRAEVSLNLFLLGSAGLFLALYFSLRTLAITFGLPRRVQAYRRRRQREKAGEVFQDAVRLLFEGRFGQALKRASESHAAGTAPGLSALIAARAAQRMRESEKQQEWMARAKSDDPRTEAATLMLEAEMMNEARRFDAALAALERLQGRHIAALRLELRALQGAGKWDAVLKLARQLEKKDALPAEVVREIKTQAHLENIASRQHDADALQAYLRSLPGAEHGRRLAFAAATALAGQGADVAAQRVIEAALGAPGADWMPELVAIYGGLSQNVAARIALAEKWLPEHPDDAGLLLALGRMCLRHRLWGKAQSYLEASLAVNESREAHLELAQLCDQLEKTEAANQHYRAGAKLAAA